ncbi:MAG TPA: hypothetical protein VN962_22095 [Polyangia bacterium]|nr:hypothetical protein [Polyangia bacterium]
MKSASSWRIAGGLWLGLAATAAGCYLGPAGPPPATVAVSADGTVYPSTPPPDPIPEYPPPSPGFGYTWVGGYWDWSGVDWNWEPGYWAPQEAGYAYIGPRFVFVDGRPVYYRPYWRGPAGRVVYGYGPRGAPPAAFRARPSVAPRAWRAEPAHSAGWRAQPGAASFHGGPVGRPGPGPAPMRPAPGAGGFRGAPPPVARPAPGPAFHGAPAPAARPAPAPAARPAPPPARSGGGFHRR